MSYRLRLNLNYTMSDNFYIALGVATNGQSDNQNQPITEGFDDYGIYLHQFIIGWKATPWATFVVGKTVRALLRQRGRHRRLR